jgi:hypothetical protein
MPGRLDKTKKMLACEEHYGLPIEDILLRLLNDGGLDFAAKELDMSITGVWFWIQRLGIKQEWVSIWDEKEVTS